MKPHFRAAVLGIVLVALPGRADEPTLRDDAGAAFFETRVPEEVARTYEVIADFLHTGTASW